MKKLFISLSFFFSFSFGPLAYSQIAVDNTMTPEQLVNNILSGPGVMISNVTFNGAPGTSINNQIGSFNNGTNSVGIANGVILCTGGITNALGPNNSGSASVPSTTNAGSDPDLDILANNSTEDKAILEFDFVPAGDTLRFKYVFASEEYNEYVCSDFNDVFGFFISGPGFSGPFTLSAENIALIPSTTTPVAINTINSGVAGLNGIPATCQAQNPNWNTTDTIYYVNNDQPGDPGFNNTQYDGFTVVLTAFAVVQCNQTYHLKIALADAGDDAFDSGVMLQANSFTSNALQISGGTLIGDSVTTDTLFMEGCQSAIYFFERQPVNAGVADTLVIGLTGTATPGVDYTNIPAMVILDSGEVKDSIIFSALADQLAEGTETVTIFITFATPCGVDTVSFSLYIQDYIPMTATMNGDTTLCPGGPAPLLDPDVQGGFGGYHYTWYPSQDTTDTLSPTPGETTVYYVNIEDDCGKSITSAPVTIVIQCPIIVPNIITANEDGLNDTFIITNIEQYPNNEVWFFNRWGVELYHARGYKNDWTPKLVDGVYFYVVDNKVDDPFKGFFSIFKNP